MHTQSFTNLSQLYSNIVYHESENYFYDYERYGAHFSTALFYSAEKLDLNLFKEELRKTDKIVEITDSLFYIIFNMTDIDGGLKATENILSTYEKKHFSQKVYTSVSSTQSSHQKEFLSTHLFSLLDFAIKENKYNEVLDDFHDLYSYN
jgi:hypothetical protein